MSTTKPSSRLKSVTDDLAEVLVPRQEGTADYPKLTPRVDTAMQRALDRAGSGSVPTGEPDLTNDTPTVDSDAKEERRNQDRVKRQAEKDAWQMSILIARIIKDMGDLRVVVNRQADVVPPSRNATDGLPGCRSCARKENDDGATVGGHFADVYEKSVGSGLCRDCWEFESAMDAIPPIRWCHLLHTQKKRAANRWLADNHPDLVAVAQKRAKIRNPKAPKLCGHPSGKTDAPCARRFMHEGQCMSAAEMARLDECPTPVRG